MDTNEQITELQKQIDELKALIAPLQRFALSLTSAADLPEDVQRSLILSLTSVSSKIVTSENQSVNESGAALYSVLKPPDRFIRIGDQNIPAYDS